MDGDTAPVTAQQDGPAKGLQAEEGEEDQVLDAIESDEDETQLNKAIQLNLAGNMARTANLADLVQMQRELALRLLEGGYQPPSIETDAGEYENGDEEDDED